MRYVLQITRQEASPDYGQLLKAYEEQRATWTRQGRSWAYQGEDALTKPEPFVSSGVLAIELTEEQWQAVKKAVLETWQ